MTTYLTTEAGKQIERALEQGYDVAAFNLYRDAIQNDVDLVMGEGSAEWHLDIQARTGLTAQAEDAEELYGVLADADDYEDEDAEDDAPLPQDASGRVSLGHGGDTDPMDEL